MHHRPRPGRGSPKPWSSLQMATDQAPGNESDGRQISRTSARPRSPADTANTIPLASQRSATMPFAHGINASSPYLGRRGDAKVSLFRSVVSPLFHHHEADARSVARQCESMLFGRVPPLLQRPDDVNGSASNGVRWPPSWRDIHRREYPPASTAFRARWRLFGGRGGHFVFTAVLPSGRHRRSRASTHESLVLEGKVRSR